MPTLSIWAIRLALIYLVVGWGMGALLMLNKAWAISPNIWVFLGVHIAFVLFGWTFQLVIAVAYWTLPTFGARTNRGREWAAWTAVVAVNLGSIWTVAGLIWAGAPLWISAALWLLSASAFAWHLWPRVKSFGE